MFLVAGGGGRCEVTMRTGRAIVLDVVREARPI